ncbi:MAG TPA: chemotaxis protein CheB [Candidatus Acidoferrales bacterium]|nr:chemotaxis protein CheB [Candidatus Acidoferrales bacterium]
MPGSPLIAVGGSAGSIEALHRLLPCFPPNFGAAIAVVIHRSPAQDENRLVHVLERCASLPVRQARDGEPILPGHVYVGPSRVHLGVGDGALHFLVSPKENGARPAIDVLFRSAAEGAPDGVAAVLLSGMLDDGTAGLAAVKARGGLTVVQDPNDARFGDMPRNALASIDVDVVAPIDGIVPVLVDFAAAGGYRPVHKPLTSELSSFGCPDCGGVLWEREEGGALNFVCRIGHAYSPKALERRNESAIEEALWTAVRALEERADLSERLAERLQKQGLTTAAARMSRQAAEARARSRRVRNALPAMNATNEESN